MTSTPKLADRPTAGSSLTCDRSPAAPARRSPSRAPATKPAPRSSG